MRGTGTRCTQTTLAPPPTLTDVPRTPDHTLLRPLWLSRSSNRTAHIANPDASQNGAKDHDPGPLKFRSLAIYYKFRARCAAYKP
eukprot:239731-Rhodomonas_salina.1